MDSDRSRDGRRRCWLEVSAAVPRRAQAGDRGRKRGRGGCFSWPGGWRNGPRQQRTAGLLAARPVEPLPLFRGGLPQEVLQDDALEHRRWICGAADQGDLVPVGKPKVVHGLAGALLVAALDLLLDVGPGEVKPG